MADGSAASPIDLPGSDPRHEHVWLFGVCLGNDCNVKEWEADDE